MATYSNSTLGVAERGNTIRSSAAYSTCYADIEPEETSWGWKGILPVNDVVLGAGEGGIGKGLWEADVAARITRGDVMPDGSESDFDGPKNVILVTPEDHIRRAMAWRLRAAGADLSRVFDMTRVLGHDFTVPDDLSLLRREIENVGNVGLAVLDPLSQLVDRGLTGVKFVRRQVWSPLRELADSLDLSILAMHHLTKAGSVAGSAALVQAARLRLGFVLHEMDPELVVLTVEKTNISAVPEPLFYRKVGDGHGITVEYEQPDIMPDTGKSGDTVKRFLWELRDGKPRHYEELARIAGVTPENARVTLHRLSREGKVQRIKRGIYGKADPAAAKAAAEAAGACRHPNRKFNLCGDCPRKLLGATVTTAGQKASGL